MVNDRGVPSVSSGMHNNTRFPALPLVTILALLLAVVVALALVLGACSSSSKSSAGSSTADITIKDFAFTPARPVKAGATVTVQNNGHLDAHGHRLTTAPAST